MRPVPIPDTALWPGARRIVMAAPNGDLTDPLIAPVEAIEDRSSTTGMRVLTVLCALEPGDLDRLTAGAHVAFSFYGGMVPFSVDLLDPARQA